MKKKHFITSVLLLAILISGCDSSGESGDTDVFDNTGTEALHDSSPSTIEAITETDAVTVEVIPGAYSELALPTLGFEIKGVDFNNLPDDSRELFEKAVNIWCIYYIDSMLCDESTAETITMPINNSSYVYYRTGISYESFERHLKSVFTDNYIEELVKTNITFINNFDELLCLDVEGVVNADFTSMTFEITEQTEDCVKITGTAKYIAEDGYEYEKELDQQMNLVGGNWRLSVFNCWY